MSNPQLYHCPALLSLQQVYHGFLKIGKPCAAYRTIEYCYPQQAWVQSSYGVVGHFLASRIVRMNRVDSIWQVSLVIYHIVDFQIELVVNTTNNRYTAKTRDSRIREILPEERRNIFEERNMNFCVEYCSLFDTSSFAFIFDLNLSHCRQT